MFFYGNEFTKFSGQLINDFNDEGNKEMEIFKYDINNGDIYWIAVDFLKKIYIKINLNINCISSFFVMVVSKKSVKDGNVT